MPARYTATEVLRDTWWIGPVALCASLVATPIMRLIAYRAKIVDRPDDLLKPHARPVAYLGGIAICIGLLVGLGAYIAVMPDADGHWSRLVDSLGAGQIGLLMDNPLWHVFAIAVSCVLITAVGLADDILDISPRKKVYGQLLAAGILLIGGVGDHMAKTIPFLGPILPPWLLIPLSVAMLCVVVVAACNATNLLDGLDGLCGGVTGIIALGFLALAVWLAMWARYPGVDQLRVVLCLAMAGGVLGFLPYNIPPASIFMGDAGSMLLGFFVAVMMALFCVEWSVRWLMAAIVIFALPILDTALAVVRRLLSGESVFTGDRSHLYDQLVDRGMSVKQVVVLFYALSAVAATLGVVMAIITRARYAAILYTILLTIVWVVFYRLRMIHPKPRHPHAPAVDSDDTAT